MPKTRWREICSHFERLILEGGLKPGELLPSDEEIAQTWGVARLTAHRALYELARKGLICRKRGYGTVVAHPRTAPRPIIAVVLYTINQRFELELLEAVARAANDRYRIEIAETRHDYERERSILSQLVSEADAIALFPTCAPENNRLIADITAGGYPLVCLDHYPVGLSCHAVLSDHYQSARNVLERLFERGHRRIAHLTDMETTVFSTAERLRAYEDALHRHGESSKRFLRSFPYLAPNSAREYEQVLQLVLDALTSMFLVRDPPTAVFCMRHIYGVAAMEALEQLGKRVPTDFDVMTFVDRQSFYLRNAEHTFRIYQDLDGIGRMAVERISALLSGARLEPEQIVIPARIKEPAVPFPGPARVRGDWA